MKLLKVSIVENLQRWSAQVFLSLAVLSASMTSLVQGVLVALLLELTSYLTHPPAGSGEDDAIPLQRPLPGRDVGAVLAHPPLLDAIPGVTLTGTALHGWVCHAWS